MSSVPEAHQFFLEVAPYHSFPIGPRGFVWVLRVQFFLGTLDTFCVECGKESVFRASGPPLQLEVPGPRSGRSSGPSIPVGVDELLDNSKRAIWPYELWPPGGPPGPLTLSQMEPLALRDRIFQVTFACMRRPEHTLYFFFRVHGGSLSKVGQSPSLADLHLGDVKKYRKLLGDEKYREFTKAIGLHAHGVGIGAFVYLRRIFEDLISAAHHAAAKEAGWDEGVYGRSRMDEKIRLLEDKLPGFLVENRAIYSILSSGVHELTEQRCLDIFEPLRVGIELILDA